jgi:hypothetical protein
MPSPFPGMDPYIEMEEWQEFHVAMITEIWRQLSPLVMPKYFARVERRVFLERHFDDPTQFQPDVQISRRHKARKAVHTASGSVATIEPLEFVVPMPEEHREPYVILKNRRSREIVTVIELLSPTNKAAGSVGHREYSDKREQLLQSHVNLVEIDLLRKGIRPSTARPLPAWTDYCAFVHRQVKRPRAEVYPWTIRDPLPTIPVPLANGDPDVPLDLERAFHTVYDLAGYQLEIEYRAPPTPPLRKNDQSWLKQVLSNWRSRGRRES